MKKIVKITENDLSKLINKIISDEEFLSEQYNWGKLPEPNTRISTKLPTIYSSVFDCLPAKVRPFLEFISKNKESIKRKLGIDSTTLIMLSKAAVGIIGRESSFMNSSRYNIKSLLSSFGIGGSFGPAQMTKETWSQLGVNKNFNLSDEDINNVVGGGLGVILYLNNSYKKALNIGYTTKKSMNVDGTGNSALDLSIASYNAGLEKTHKKFCKNTNDKIAHVCKSDEKNVLINYIPNYPTNKWYTGELTTKGYVNEVGSYYKKYSCIDGI